LEFVVNNPRATLSLKPGAEVLYNERRCRIKQVIDLNLVLVIDRQTDHVEQAKISDLKSLAVSPDCAFPYQNYLPAELFKLFNIAGISGLVRFNLGFPEFRTSLWQSEILTVVSVPETSVHKNHSAVLGQNNIRFSREVSHMQPEPVSCCMKGSADKQLRLCVF
jgi:hypothetical protein